MILVRIILVFFLKKKKKIIIVVNNGYHFHMIKANFESSKVFHLNFLLAGALALATQKGLY